jgi:hypothetical protein
VNAAGAGCGSGRTCTRTGTLSIENDRREPPPDSHPRGSVRRTVLCTTIAAAAEPIRVSPEASG